MMQEVVFQIAPSGISHHLSLCGQGRRRFHDAGTWYFSSGSPVSQIKACLLMHEVVFLSASPGISAPLFRVAGQGLSDDVAMFQVA